jgi:hypothetical protein
MACHMPVKDRLEKATVSDDGRPLTVVELIEELIDGRQSAIPRLLNALAGPTHWDRASFDCSLELISMLGPDLAELSALPFTKVDLDELWVDLNVFCERVSRETGSL